MSKEYYLTPERLRQIKAELEDLKTNQRTVIAERLKRAKELGDLSENSEYMEAREAQGQLEQRIYELEETIRNAVLIRKKGKSDQVNLGSTIVVRRSGKKFKFTLVGSNEARPETGFISNESPLGQAFLNKKTGEKVKVKTPAGKVIYEIIAID